MHIHTQHTPKTTFKQASMPSMVAIVYCLQQLSMFGIYKEMNNDEQRGQSNSDCIGLCHSL